MTISLGLKAVHVVAVVAFVGGTLVDAFALRLAGAIGAGRERIVPIVRRWDARVTTPAMLLVWALGIALALRGHWFGRPWLTLKLVAVLALSALHGIQAGRLRRLAAVDDAGATGPGVASPVAILTIAAIAIVLVVLKPGF